MIQIECCDNLELMSKIESGTVDLIYCDILYGTGRKFADYQDLKPIRSEIEKHYLPRLIEMKRVLKQNGSIYLQMDTRINHWMRILMDNVFGYDNFRNEIVWTYRSGGGSNKKFGQKHDVIIYYSMPNATFNVLREPYSAIIADKRKHLFNDNGKALGDSWDLNLLSTVSKERVGYATQKPKALIERIIKASSNEGDLVADFYLGSGTTCEVALELGRKFIGCDINPRAVELSKKRCGIFS